MWWITAVWQNWGQRGIIFKCFPFRKSLEKRLWCNKTRRDEDKSFPSSSRTAWSASCNYKEDYTRLVVKSFRFGSNAMTNLLLYWTDDYGFEYNSEFNSQWVNGMGFHWSLLHLFLNKHISDLLGERTHDALSLWADTANRPEGRADALKKRAHALNAIGLRWLILICFRRPE